MFTLTAKSTSWQRLSRIVRHTAPGHGLRSPIIVARTVSTSADDSDRVTIGDVSVQLKGRKSLRPDLVPIHYDDPEDRSQESLQTLRWMIQKHSRTLACFLSLVFSRLVCSVKQDVFLIGPPGPQRRRLAL